jgi:hypothetical protein
MRTRSVQVATFVLIMQAEMNLTMSDDDCCTETVTVKGSSEVG